MDHPSGRPATGSNADPAAVAVTPPSLRRILVSVDTLALLLAWLGALLFFRSRVGAIEPSSLRLAGTMVVGVGAGLFLMSTSGLYRRAVCYVRSVELARLGRVAGLLVAFGAMVTTGQGPETAMYSGVVVGTTAFVLLAVERGFVREWIQGRRAGGHYRAPVIVVGGSADVLEMARLLHDHPVLGFDVVGMSSPVGPPQALPFPWCDPQAGVGEAARAVGATGVILDAGSLAGAQLTDVVRSLRSSDVHIHVASALRGVSSRRITVSPVADETFLHIAPSSLTNAQRAAKRALDLVVAGTLLLCTAPLLLLAMLATWLQDGRPVIFRQTRVGRDGELFTVYKLRTMVMDAERRLADLSQQNGRDGPLFKVVHDPRVTTLGRLLRATSLDELPQLMNVLGGSMSMVGPRPALPQEVAQFDAELNGRSQVKPGLTGLWQVEARDLASFDLYRRYDLLYVENWSLGLDVAIIARTVTATLLRAFRALVPTSPRASRTAVLD